MRIILSLALCCAAAARIGCSTGAPIMKVGDRAVVGVEIPYSTTASGLTFKSSINLGASRGRIHRNYDGWIQNLNRDIDVQFAVS